MTGPRDDWGRYWREVAVTSGATLADLPAPVQQRLDAPWSTLAAALPRGGRVLDLATGGGVVLAMLRHRRRDLKLTGVDAATAPPSRSGMALKGGVSIDALPFRDGSFDAVTSRFGIEYATLTRAAAEAARVCRTGGRICFVVHHAQSPVLRHNRARYDALRWASRDSGWMEVAANLVRARETMALPTPTSLRAAAADAMQRFPSQTAATDFLAGLLQLLDAGLGRPGVAVPGLAALATRADDELSRLEALFEAACDDARLEIITAALGDCGIELAPVETIDERPGGEPLAWLIGGRKL